MAPTTGASSSSPTRQGGAPSPPCSCGWSRRCASSPASAGTRCGCRARGAPMRASMRVARWRNGSAPASWRPSPPRGRSTRGCPLTSAPWPWSVCRRTSMCAMQPARRTGAATGWGGSQSGDVHPGSTYSHPCCVPRSRPHPPPVHSAPRSYDLHLGPVADPFSMRYRHHPRRPDRLDLCAVADAAALLVGTHNFAAFSNASADGAHKKNPVKTILRYEVLPLDGGARCVHAGTCFGVVPSRAGGCYGGPAAHRTILSQIG